MGRLPGTIWPRWAWVRSRPMGDETLVLTRKQREVLRRLGKGHRLRSSSRPVGSHEASAMVLNKLAELGLAAVEEGAVPHTRSKAQHRWYVITEAGRALLD